MDRKLPKYAKRPSNLHFIVIIYHYLCIIIVIIISCGLFRLINDLSGPLKTVFHTANIRHRHRKS